MHVDTEDFRVHLPEADHEESRCVVEMSIIFAGRRVVISRGVLLLMSGLASTRERRCHVVHVRTEDFRVHLSKVHREESGVLCCSV